MEKGNNKEITKERHLRDSIPGKEIINHRWKHHLQNTRDSRKNVRYRKYFRKHWNNRQRKCEKQNSPNPKESINSIPQPNDTN